MDIQQNLVYYNDYFVSLQSTNAFCRFYQIFLKLPIIIIIFNHSQPLQIFVHTI